jgi:ADP-ribosylglycohydrolase
VAESATDPGVTVEPAWKICRLYGLACPLASLMPAALYLVGRFTDDFESAVLHAVNGGGNNLGRSALAGALAGALVGVDGIPERFMMGLFDHRKLLEQAWRVAEAAE